MPQWETGHWILHLGPMIQGMRHPDYQHQFLPSNYSFFNGTEIFIFIEKGEIK